MSDGDRENLADHDRKTAGLINADLIDADSMNPFAAPTTSATIESVGGNPNPLPPPILVNVFGKWLVICAFAAGPSFMMGGGMGGWRPAAVWGMLAGIFVFVIGYTAIEFTAAVQEQMNKPVSRRASWIAYLTRVGISIVFPVGMTVDILCGIFAVGFSSSITGFVPVRFSAPGEADFSHGVLFFQFLFTTVIQGLLLNLVLFAYMGIVWLICKAASRD